MLKQEPLFSDYRNTLLILKKCGVQNLGESYKNDRAYANFGDDLGKVRYEKLREKKEKGAILFCAM